MNQNAQFHVVLDIDGTTPPITVVSGSAEEQYWDAIKKRCKKTADFRKDYKRADEPSLSIGKACRKQIHSCCSCDKDAQKKFWNKRFPFLRIMRKYKFKTDLMGDIIAGLTVGIMQLPQGMSYALLAELPPVVGLYMAFFPVLIYFFLGTSKHISMGTIALCSLLTGSVISRFYDASLASSVLGDSVNNNTMLTSNLTSTASVDDDEDKVDLPNHVKIAIASSLCLLVGFVQLAMGIFRMGFITTYMSDAMLTGFTTGAAVHVGTSQVKYVFGLHIPRSDGVFQIIKTYSLIFKHIADTNLPTLLVSGICIFILYMIKVQVNTRFKHKLRFPLPVELFVVVCGTVASYFLKFEENYKMKIVGEIQAGLPKPTIPSMPASTVYTADAVVIAIVAFSQCIGLAALMAKKHGYSYDANQELIAYGAGNIFGSFFSCYPYAASVSRSSVQESAGGKTQLASVVSASMVLVVIVSIGPLFESLPNCVLASIIIVAIRSLLLQVLELPKIYRTSVYDFLVWIVTFLAVVILHVDYGILIGMLFSFFTVVVRTQRTKAANLQKIEEMHVYENSSSYVKTRSVSGIKVIGFTSPLYYANAALFVKQVYMLSNVTPEKRRKQLKKLALEHEVLAIRNSSIPLVNETNEMGSVQNLEYYDNIVDPTGDNWKNSKTQDNILAAMSNTELYYIVLDCSSITFIDTSSAKIIKQLVDDFESVKIQVVLSCVNDEVWRVLEVTEFLKTYQDRVFLTVDDAVNAALLNVKLMKATEKKQMMYRENNNPDADEDEALLAMESVF